MKAGDYVLWGKVRPRTSFKIEYIYDTHPACKPVACIISGQSGRRYRDVPLEDLRPFSADGADREGKAADLAASSEDSGIGGDQ